MSRSRPTAGSRWAAAARSPTSASRRRTSSTARWAVRSGGDPVIAAMWNDLDLGNDPASQEVRVQRGPDRFGSREFRVTLAQRRPLSGDGRSAPCDLTIKSNGEPSRSITPASARRSPAASSVVSSGRERRRHDDHDPRLLQRGHGAPNSFFSSSSFRNTIYRNYNIFSDSPSEHLHALLPAPERLRCLRHGGHLPSAGLPLIFILDAARRFRPRGGFRPGPFRLPPPSARSSNRVG